MPSRVPRTAQGLVLALALLPAGCGEAVPGPAPPGPHADAAAAFDPATAGTVRGRVVWTGAVPLVPGYRAPVSPLSEQSGGPPRPWPNPHAPAVDRRGCGVAGAVVFLRGVDPRRARPWDLPVVTVELRGFRVCIRQGDAEETTGFVRRGDAVEFRSAQRELDTLVARGDAFFALAFPPGGRPCTRVLGRRGTVELSSGAGHFWMRGHLFVDDHPYYARTDATGAFTLPQVPPGEYEVVCWHPDWHEAGHELDADTGLVARLFFRPPVTVRRPVRVRAGQKAEVSFTLSADLFGH
jgi:hypothetical protein